MNRLKVITLTYKSAPLHELNHFFLHDENHDERLSFLKFTAGLEELMYLATCNRIAFIFSANERLSDQFLHKFFQAFRPDWNLDQIERAIKHTLCFEGEQAIHHLYQVASSLDSMVLGEREIITQVRKAYDRCNAISLTGDLIRLVIKSVITAAKKVYTDTHIATQPVSIVSIAHRKIVNLKLDKRSKIVLIGAGETIINISKYLIKEGFGNFSIFNRTLHNAALLADTLSSNTITATPHALDDLVDQCPDFDLLITCTGSATPIITSENYQFLANSNKSHFIVDLALPADVESNIATRLAHRYIGLEEIKQQAAENLALRNSELIAAEKIIAVALLDFKQMLKTRMVELKMREVPEQIKAIKENAVASVFAKDIEGLDPNSREVLEKVLNYMEKKYISVPMILAKEIILDTND